MQITKCDLCKKVIEGDIYALEMHNVSRITIFDHTDFDLCGDCYRKLCEKLRNKEEEDAT